MGHQQILPQYQKIVHQHTQAQYLITKRISVSFHSNQSLQELWSIHDAAIQHPILYRSSPEQSLLDLKILLADKIFRSCYFCQHRCKINRTQTAGFCQQLEPLIASMFSHQGEEELFVPSYTIFFSGCNFHCQFCQNWDISQQSKGITISPENCARYLSEQANSTIKNLNWVGGEPTPHIPFILKTLQKMDHNLPQIWNSNMYCSTETLSLLQGVIDVYLTDFKFGNNTCAQQLAQVPHYVETIRRNHSIIGHTAEVFIRHLILPGHMTCCSKPIIDWVAQQMPHTPVHLMNQYHPCYKSKNNPLLNRKCNKTEINEIMAYAEEKNICLY